MRAPLRRLLLAVGSAALTLLACEFVVEWTDPFGISYYADSGRYMRHAVQAADLCEEGRLFEQRPSVELAMRSFDVRTDAFGFRAAVAGAPVGPRQADEVRVLFLGDSATFGWGVDDEHTWLRRLERDARWHDGRRLRCFNAGHLLYDTVQQASLFAAWEPRVNPELVVVVFNANDLDLSWQTLLANTERAQAEALDGAKGGVLGRAWAAVSGHFSGLRDLLTLRRQLRDPRALHRGAGALADLPGYPRNWPAVVRARARHQARIELFVFDHSRPRIPNARRWCGERDVPWVDLAFTDEDWAREIRVSKADSHANVYGNELLEHKALAGLAALGVLQEPAAPAAATR
jgi:hypothetical protein